MKECRAQQERKQGTLKLVWERKRHRSFTASAMGEKEWGKGVGMNATLTLLNPDSILGNLDIGAKSLASLSVQSRNHGLTASHRGHSAPSPQCIADVGSNHPRVEA